MRKPFTIPATSFRMSPVTTVFIYLALLVLSWLFIPSPLQAKALTVGTIVRPPMVMRGADSAQDFTGFSIELWQEIAKRNQYQYTLREFTDFSKMISATEKSAVDLSIANISVTAKREQTMDYSQPIYSSGLQIAVPRQSQGLSFFRLLWESGIVLFLAVAALILLIVAHIIWYFERGGEGQDYFRDDYKNGIWDAFWWAFIIVTMGGFEDKQPGNWKGRIFAIFWIIVGLFFVSTFTAKITTSLTVSELKSGISSYQDLAGKKVGVTAGSTAEEFLRKNNITTIPYQDITDLWQDLEAHRLDAIVHDSPIVSYYSKHKGRGKIKLAGEVFKPENYAIIFPENSPLIEPINRTLLELKEDGTYQALLQKYFGK